MSHPAFENFETIHNLASRAWPSFQRLRIDGQLCDVKLVVAGSSVDDRTSDRDDQVSSGIMAHRIVLSAASPYFEVMFSSKSSDL